MGLESASYISQLVATNPTGSDQKSSMDDHVRLIKTVLQSQFTSLGAAPVTITAAELNASVGAALAAASAAGATVFSGTTAYAQYAAVISPVNMQTYRRNTAGTNATDPSSDAANWTLITGDVTSTNTKTLTNKTLTDAIASGSFLLTSGTGGIGYGTGAGSTATQPTSKSTSVTLNKSTGKITMHNAALAANTAVTFICLNSTVTAGCTVSVSLVGGYAGLLSDYLVTTYTEAGLIGFGVRNMTGGSLSDALQIQFNVIKGATA